MKRWTEADGKPEVSRTSSVEEISVTLLNNFSCVINWCIFLDEIWYSNSKPKSCGYIPLYYSYVTGTLQSSDILIFLLETCISNLMASVYSFWPLLGAPVPESSAEQSGCLQAVGFRAVTLWSVALLAFMQIWKFWDFFLNCLSHVTPIWNYDHLYFLFFLLLFFFSFFLYFLNVSFFLYL